MKKPTEFNPMFLWGIVILIGIFGTLIWLSRPSGNAGENGTQTESGQGALSSEETLFDFGTVSMAAGTVRHEFKIRNNGSGTSTIDRLYTSCMCTTVTLIKGETRKGPYGMQGHGYIPKINEAIAPGEEATLEVVFDPAAHGPAGVGPTNRIVYVEQKDGDTLELGIKTVVTP